MREPEEGKKKKYFSIRAKYILNLLGSVIVPVIVIIIGLLLIARSFFNSETRKKTLDALENVKQIQSEMEDRLREKCRLLSAIVSSQYYYQNAQVSEIIKPEILGSFFKLCEVVTKGRTLFRAVNMKGFFFQESYYSGQGQLDYFWARLSSPSWKKDNVLFYTYVTNWNVIQKTCICILDNRQNMSGMVILTESYDTETCNYMKSLIDGEVTMFSGGKVLASSVFDTRSEILPAGLYDAMCAALVDQKYFFSEFTVFSRNYSMGFAPLFDNKKKIIALLSVAVDETGINRFFMTTALFLAGVLIVMFGIIIATGFLSSRVLLRPIFQLVSATRVMRQGNLNVYISQGSHDEIGELISSFNEMAAMISDMTVGLERKVEDRTNELKNALDIQVQLNNALLKTGRELDEANLKLQELDRHKTETLHMVTHELRTPLTSIMGFAKIIKIQVEKGISLLIVKKGGKTIYISPEIEEEIRVVISECERLANLINDYLDLSKLEAGKMEFRYEKLDLPAVISESLMAIDTIISQSGLEFRVEVNEGLPPVWADKENLQQVVINMVSNAIKFTPKGAIAISAAPEEGRLRVSIADTGTGISAEDLDHIFEKFYRASVQVRGARKGTGLGLPISKQIIEKMGGEIRVKSEPGKGSVFSFTVPLAGGKDAAGANVFEKNKKHKGDRS